MGAITVYDYIKNLFDECGIDLKSIDKNNILAECENYPGEISKESYALLLKAIDELYKNI